MSSAAATRTRDAGNHDSYEWLYLCLECMKAPMKYRIAGLICNEIKKDMSGMGNIDTIEKGRENKSYIPRRIYELQIHISEQNHCMCYESWKPESRYV